MNERRQRDVIHRNENLSDMNLINYQSSKYFPLLFVESDSLILGMENEQRSTSMMFVFSVVEIQDF